MATASQRPPGSQLGRGSPSPKQASPQQTHGLVEVLGEVEGCWGWNPSCISIPHPPHSWPLMHAQAGLRLQGHKHWPRAGGGCRCLGTDQASRTRKGRAGRRVSAEARRGRRRDLSRAFLSFAFFGKWHSKLGESSETSRMKAGLGRGQKQVPTEGEAGRTENLTKPWPALGVGMEFRVWSRCCPSEGLYPHQTWVDGEKA